MQFYTSYYAQVRNFPPGLVGISISLRTMRYFKGPRYDALAPTPFILGLKDKPDEYTEHFMHRLRRLDPQRVLRDLNSIASGKPWAVLCYERPGEFCHRHLVASWLSESIPNLSITEFNKHLHK